MSAKKSKAEVEVLYQKIGAKWYAFSIVGDEIFSGSLTEDQLHEAGVVGLDKFIDSPDTSFDGELEIS